MCALHASLLMTAQGVILKILLSISQTFPSGLQLLNRLVMRSALVNLSVIRPAVQKGWGPMGLWSVATSGEFIRIYRWTCRNEWVNRLSSSYHPLSDVRSVWLAIGWRNRTSAFFLHDCLWDRTRSARSGSPAVTRCIQAAALPDTRIRRCRLQRQQQ